MPRSALNEKRMYFVRVRARIYRGKNQRLPPKLFATIHSHRAGMYSRFRLDAEKRRPIIVVDATLARGPIVRPRTHNV